MFVIRNKQIDVFRASALRRFEDEMVEHVKEFFPEHYYVMKESNTRITIQYGYIRAKTYGLTTIRNVCLYLNNMLMLGSNFDSDPQYPWAKQILTDKTVEDPVLRINELTHKTMEQIDKISGKGNIYICRAMLNLARNSDKIFYRLIRGRLSKVFYHLQFLFKQKYEVVGEANLDEMVKRGIKNAQEYGITDESNVLVYISCMFMMGSGFDKDPQFTWAEKILNDQNITDQRKKVETLYHDTIIYLRSAYSI